jgi:hypothetical protein
MSKPMRRGGGKHEGPSLSRGELSAGWAAHAHAARATRGGLAKGAGLHVERWAAQTAHAVQTARTRNTEKHPKAAGERPG